MAVKYHDGLSSPNARQSGARQNAQWPTRASSSRANAGSSSTSEQCISFPAGKEDRFDGTNGADLAVRSKTRAEIQYSVNLLATYSSTSVTDPRTRQEHLTQIREDQRTTTGYARTSGVSQSEWRNSLVAEGQFTEKYNQLMQELEQAVFPEETPLKAERTQVADSSRSLRSMVRPIRRRLKPHFHFRKPITLRKSEIAMALTRPEKLGTGGRANARLERTTTILLGGTAKLRALTDELTKSAATVRRSYELAEAVAQTREEVEEQVAKAVRNLRRAWSKDFLATKLLEKARARLEKQTNELTKSTRRHKLLQALLHRMKNRLENLQNEYSRCVLVANWLDKLDDESFQQNSGTSRSGEYTILINKHSKIVRLEDRISSITIKRDRLAEKMTVLTEKINSSNHKIAWSEQIKTITEQWIEEAQQQYCKWKSQLEAITIKLESQLILDEQAQGLQNVAEKYQEQQVCVVDAMHDVGFINALSLEELGKFFDIQGVMSSKVQELKAVLSTVLVKVHSRDIAGNQGLDELLVFKIVYRAVSQSSKRDITVASRALQELMQSSMASLAGVPGERIIDEPALETAQVLASLPRGMEILLRLTVGLPGSLQAHENEKPEVETARERAVLHAVTAVSVYLQASAHYVAEIDGDAVASNLEMLANAMEAATLMFANASRFDGQFVEPLVGASDAQKAAFQAVHCNYFASQEGSLLSKVNKYLQKASTKWVDIAIQDNNAGHLQSAVSSAGKPSPFKPAVLALSQNVHSAYSLVDGETGARLDRYLETAGTAMVKVTQHLLSERTRLCCTLLFEVAAIAHALKTLNDERGNKICRPEHAFVPDLENGGRQALHEALTRQFGLSSADANQVLNSQGVLNHPAIDRHEHKIIGMLRTENLVSIWNRLKANAPDRAPDQDVKTLETALRKAMETIIEDSPVQVNSPADVYKFLDSIPHRMEQRCTARFVNGYTGGVKPPITGAVTIATGVVTGGASLVASVQPRIKLEGALTKNAIFEISFTTESLDIFIGKEKAVCGKVGLGVGGRIGFGGTGAGIRGGAYYDHSRAGESNNKEGVWLRLPVDTSSTEELRDEARQLMDTLFNWRDKIDEVTGRKRFGAELGGIPNPIGAILAMNPKVSVNLVQRESDKISKKTNALGATIGMLFPKMPLAQRLGLDASLSREQTTLRKQIIAVDSGYFSIHRNRVLVGNQVAVATRGTAAELFTLKNAQHAGEVGGVLGTGGGYSKKKLIYDNSVEFKNRWVVMNGQTHWRHSRADIEYKSFEQFKNAVNAQREEWIAVGAEKRVGVGITLDAAREAASKDLDLFLDQLEKHQTDADGVNRLRNSYIVSRCMRKESAAYLDGLLALEQLEIQQGNLDEAARINAEQDKVFRNEHSFQNLMLFANEKTRHKRAVGIDFGAVVSSSIGAEGQRPELLYF